VRTVSSDVRSFGSEHDYTSTNPTLACTHCRGLGHTVNHCPFITLDNNAATTQPDF
jgi:hypothetical protein